MRLDTLISAIYVNTDDTLQSKLTSCYFIKKLYPILYTIKHFLTILYRFN